MRFDSYASVVLTVRKISAQISIFEGESFGSWGIKYGEGLVMVAAKPNLHGVHHGVHRKWDSALVPLACVLVEEEFGSAAEGRALAFKASRQTRPSAHHGR